VVTAGGGEKSLACANAKKRTAKFVFVVRQEKTHGKVCVCHAPMQKRTANVFLAVRFFRRASLKNARQSTSLPCARKNTHGKHLGARHSRSVS
jgi:hypothetical protein